MAGQMPIVHAAKNGAGNWCVPHDPAEHLREVGELAAGFAAPNGAGAD